MVAVAGVTAMLFSVLVAVPDPGLPEEIEDEQPVIAPISRRGKRRLREGETNLANLLVPIGASRKNRTTPRRRHTSGVVFPLYSRRIRR